MRVELESNDRPVNLIEERFDIALQPREGSLDDSSLVTRRIASGRFVLVASPAYLVDKPPIDQPQQLARHDTIGALRDGSEQRWGVGCN